MYYCIVGMHKPAVYCNAMGQCQMCIDYQAGLTKPAYPVPAIPLDVDLRYGIIWNAYPGDRPNEPMACWSID